MMAVFVLKSMTQSAVCLKSILKTHAAQAHHTPLHAINNENKAGKRKKKQRTGVGNEEMPLVTVSPR